jgi:hypothetical protein
VIGRKAAKNAAAHVLDSDCREGHGCQGFERVQPVMCPAGDITRNGTGFLARHRVHEQEETETEGGEQA